MFFIVTALPSWYQLNWVVLSHPLNCNVLLFEKVESAILDRLSDEELMVLYQEGEVSAFDELYRRTSGRVFAYLSLRVGKEEAKEILQNTFLKMHQGRHLYNKEFPFLPWIFSICRHLLIDYFRAKKLVPVENTVLEKMLDRDVEQIEKTRTELDENAMWDKVAKHLTRDQRALIRLRFEEGLSFECISEKLGISQVSVRKRVSRLFSALRKLGAV